MTNCHFEQARGSVGPMSFWTSRVRVPLWPLTMLSVHFTWYRMSSLPCFVYWFSNQAVVKETGRLLCAESIHFQQSITVVIRVGRTWMKAVIVRTCLSSQWPGNGEKRRWLRTGCQVFVCSAARAPALCWPTIRTISRAVNGVWCPLRLSGC